MPHVKVAPQRGQVLVGSLITETPRAFIVVERRQAPWPAASCRR
jgi:hypothetical protein